MARDSLAREAVRKTAVGRFDSGPCLFGAHAVDGRGRLAPGRVEARRLSPTFNGVDAGSNPARRTIGGSSIGRALNDPVCAPTFARLPAVPGRRHRACGAGTGRRPPVTCLEKQKPSGSRYLIRAGTGGAAGRVEDGRLSRDRKASSSNPAPCRYVGLGQLSRRASGVNSGCRIPHPPGPQPSNPITSARTGGPNPQ